MKIINHAEAADPLEPARIRRPARAGQLGLVIGAAMAAAILGGCGSSGDGGVAHVGSPTTSAASASSPKKPDAAAFAQCMRAHGVPQFPDPNSQGKFIFTQGEGVNPSSPAFQTASQACKSLAPQGTVSPQQASQSSSRAVKFAQCMRTHGVPTFPDPQSLGGGNFTETLPQGIDPNSPQFQGAIRACRSLSVLPVGGGAP